MNDDRNGQSPPTPGAPRISGPGRVLGPVGRTSGGGEVKGLWGVVARGLALAAGGLLRLSRIGVSEARVRGGRALQDFSQRPEQTRQRVYAFGCYGAVVLLTFAAQLWDPNSLQAHVRVEPVALPEATVCPLTVTVAPLLAAVGVTVMLLLEVVAE